MWSYASGDYVLKKVSIFSQGPNGEDEEESGHFEMALILRILLLGYLVIKIVLDTA